MILRCVDEVEARNIPIEFHSRFSGGHYVAKTTTHKILIARYFWPFIFVDVHKHVRDFQACQLFTGKQKLDSFPLHPVVM